MRPEPFPALDRRGLVAGALALAVAGRAWAANAAADLAAAEKACGGRLGVHVRDTGSGATLTHRDGERFPMCSTFKALLVGRVLARVDRGEMSLAARVAYGRADLLPVSPITGRHVADGGLPLADLCAAAIQYSDNAAANLLLRETGGPAALTAWLRAQGDAVTRLDRNEPSLNSAIAGDPRDTSTPAAMSATFGRLTLGETLKPASREHLRTWLDGNTTGAERLRAGLPKDWIVGDKTGSNGTHTANDVALIRPPGRAPLTAAVFVTGARSQDAAVAAIAEVGRIIVRSRSA